MKDLLWCNVDARSSFVQNFQGIAVAVEDSPRVLDAERVGLRLPGWGVMELNLRRD